MTVVCNVTSSVSRNEKRIEKIVTSSDQPEADRIENRPIRSLAHSHLIKEIEKMTKIISVYSTLTKNYVIFMH